MSSLKVMVHGARIRRTCRWMVLGVVSVLAACSVGPQYKRPDIAPPVA